MAGKHGKKDAKGDGHHQKVRDRRGRPSRRRLEGRVRRFRHRDDGVLPADVAAERDDRGPAQGSRGLFQPQQPDVACLLRHRAAVRRPHRVRRRRAGVRPRQRADHHRQAPGHRADRGRRRPGLYRNASRPLRGGVGKGPLADDQDADDTDEKPLGQKGTRPAPGPGGTIRRRTPRAAGRSETGHARPRSQPKRNARRKRRSSRRRTKSSRRCGPTRRWPSLPSNSPST